MNSDLAGFDFLRAAGLGPREAAIRLDRACAELRRGRTLALRTRTGWLWVAAVEMLSPALWQQLQASCGSSGSRAAVGPVRLLLSAERLQALGWQAAGQTAAGAFALPAGTPWVQLQQWAALGDAGAAAGQPQRALAAPAGPGLDEVAPAFTAACADEAEAWAAALALCKRVRLLPALVMVALPAEAADALQAAQVLTFDPADAAQPPQAPASAGTPAAAGLRRVSDARVPLAAEENCTLVLFREVDGDAEHVAIIVGEPPASGPVPVRLHSACLTGDLLGSLRCDCGPQLQRAVARLAETGGVLLYLAQEGRATGLANKLRAYRLQDSGLDTLQADRYLGFREDERDFAAAAAMLQALGHTRIQLLTNNPQKIEALRLAGIEVVERLPLHGQVNAHNERYIRTKQQAGHLGQDA